MKIGRNEPCPCGSGKKYKKCCPNKQEEIATAVATAPDDDLLSPGEIRDYGPANLNQQFFDDSVFIEMSPQGLLYYNLMNPELASVAARFVKQQESRHIREERRIEEAADLEGLIEIMKQEPDPLNHELLMQKVLERADEAIPRILNELPRSQNNTGFVEVAIQIIYRSKVDCSAELLDLIKVPIENAYTLSLLSLLLGLVGTEDAIKPLWDRYHFFKERFPREHYMQGPLFGLYELALRHGRIPAVSEDLQQRVDQVLKRRRIACERYTAEQVAKLLMRNQKIEAIKVLCKEADVGLKEAKDAVDQILADE